MAIKKALVVDDSMSARVMLRRMLEQRKVAVDLAETAEQALEYLQKQRPDVVFMDHILPGMSGFEATKAISNDPNTSEIPVVMYTSKEGDSYFEQAREHGAVGVLRKPARPDALEKVLDQLRGEAVPAVAPKAEEKPAVAPPTARPAAAMATGDMEAVARRIAEAVVAASVEAMVKRQLDAELGRMRQDILSRGKVAAKEIAEQASNTHTQESATQLRRELNDRIADIKATLEAAPAVDQKIIEEVKRVAIGAVGEAAAEEATETAKKVARLAARNVAENTAGIIARQVANELYSTRATELAHQVQKQVNDQLAELKTSLESARTLHPALAHEIKNVARNTAVQAAVDTAGRTAEKAGRQIAATIAEQTAEFAARRVAEDAVETLRADIGRLYLMGGAAVVVSLVSVLLYFFN